MPARIQISWRDNSLKKGTSLRKSTFSMNVREREDDMIVSFGLESSWAKVGYKITGTERGNASTRLSHQTLIRETKQIQKRIFT
jgi:hypothetical protein